MIFVLKYLLFTLQGTLVDDGQCHHFWRWSRFIRNDCCSWVNVVSIILEFVCLHYLFTFLEQPWMKWEANIVALNHEQWHPSVMTTLVILMKLTKLVNSCKQIYTYDVNKYVNKLFFSADIDTIISDNLFKQDDDEARRNAMIGFIDLKWHWFVYICLHSA